MKNPETKHPTLTAALTLAAPAFLASVLALPATVHAAEPFEATDEHGHEQSRGEPVRLSVEASPRPETPDRYEAETERPPEDDAPAPLDDQNLAAWDHFEFSMGFVGGWRRFDRMAFEGDPSLDPSLYRTEPLDGVQAYGLRYDVRLVVAYTRMTVGIDFPFTQYTVADTARTLPSGQQATVAQVKPFAFRFGIGGEIPIGPVAPFVDILGSIHSVRATYDIDDVEREVKARSFGFSARAGLRLHVRKWFFASLAGEVGIVGPTVWAAELSVGFAVM